MKYLGCLLLFVCISCIYSCTKDKTLQPAPQTCVGVDSATNTYSLRIESVLLGNCGFGGCHNAATHQSGIILDNYNDAKTAFETKPVLCAIKQESGCLPMPQGYDKLADSLITYLQCWSENGYPQ